MDNLDEYNTPFNGDLASVSVTKVIPMQDDVKIGSLQIVLDSNWNGTTATFNILGSNDNINYTQVYQTGTTTAMALTPITGPQQLSFIFQGIYYKFYQVIYTKGNASTGTITGNFIGKK